MSGDLQFANVEFVGPIHGHDSPLEAIAAATQRDKLEKAAQDTSPLIGQCITDVMVGQSWVCLGASSGCWLSIRVVGTELIWSIEDERPAKAPSDEVPSPIILEFPNGERIKWLRKAILRNLIGCKVSQIFFGEGDIYLYTSGVPIVAFSAMRLCASGEPLLYWCESQ